MYPRVLNKEQLDPTGQQPIVPSVKNCKYVVYIRAVGIPENPGVPVVMWWA